jgi:hypothetical protein
VQVTFYKLTEQRCTTWVARRGPRGQIPGSTMALGRGGLPHDLTQLVIEATLELEHGFWGCVAAGGTFRSMGRQRTRASRAVIAAHRADLGPAEKLVGEHEARWKAGQPTPVAEPLRQLAERWDRLTDRQGLTVEWPSLRVVA